MARGKFDPKPLRLGAVINMICGATEIYEGDVVAFEATPANMTVVPCIGMVTGATMGVALHDAKPKEKVAVASTGSIVKARIEQATDAGDELEADLSVSGALQTYAGSYESQVVGYALEDNTGGLTSYVFINGPHLLPKTA